MRLVPLFAVTGLLALAPAAEADLFAPAEHFPAGVTPQFLATADFNRDGDRDFVVGNQATTSGVLMGGHGLSFGSPISIPAGSSSSLGVAVADFNGDADQDLAFARFPGLSVVTREDDGTFSAPTPVLATGAITAVAAGDFNRDGDPDLAAVQDGAALGSTVWTALGGPGAGFQTPIPSFAVVTPPRAITVADFNRDGDQDLAVASATTSGLVSVLLGTPTGFAPAVDYPAGDTPEAIVAGDFDGDGFPDVAVANFGLNGVSVLLGGPGGVLGQPTAYPNVAQAPASLAAADFNSDGNLDLAVASVDLNFVRVLLGGAGGTFQTVGQTFPVGLAPLELVADDFDGDGRADLASANFDGGNVSVLLNAAQPAIETNPSGLNFGTQAHATISAPRTITVHSTGERALRIQRLRKIGLTPDDYLITTDTCTGAIVAPGGSCTIAVRFAPEATGPHEANLQIDSDAATNSIFDVPLNGTGGALPAGPAGPAGADGSPGVSANARPLLATVFAADRQSVRAGKQLRLRYVSTMDALVTVELRRGARVVRRFTATAVAGRNTLSFRVRGRGRYTLALTAVAGDQRVTDAARLTVLRRRT
jgi:VCBS repeat protein/centrosomal CEP192-like protein